MGIYLIARDNIKKKKGNALILFLLIALAVLLLYVGISVLSNMGKVIDSRNAVTNGADYFLFTFSPHTDEIEEIINNQEETAYQESEKTIYASGVKFYNGKESEKEASQIEFFFLDKEAARKLSRIEIIDKGSEWKDNSIILPYYMKAGLGYKSGEILKLLYNNHTYAFEIYGFTEDVMFSTPTNISAIKCFISPEYFKTYTKEWGGTGTMYHAALTKGSDTEKYEEKLNHKLNELVSDFQNLPNWSANYATMKYGTGITANLFMGVLTVFAMLLILISLVIVHFNISNSIEMNMKNIGMLEASGYTSRQMLAATVLEFMLISIFGSCIGLIGAKSVSNMIGGIVSASIGIYWKMAFDLLSAFLSVFITILLVLSAAMVCSRKFKKITPLDALRGGIHTHNFKRNLIQLDTSSLPLNPAIGIKSIFFNKKKNITICIIIVILTFCANEAMSIYQNFALQNDNLIEIIGFELPDITVDAQENNLNADAVKSIKQKAMTVAGVDQILEYTAVDLICKKGEKEVTVNFDIYDNADNLRVDNVIEGRRPKYDNELMLTAAMSDKLGVTVGEVVYLEMNGAAKDYLLVGKSQGINQLGRKALITKAGMDRLNSGIIPSSLFIYAVEGTDLDAMIDELKDILYGENVTVRNYQEYTLSSMRSIVTVMKSLCVVMLTAVLLVIALILMLLIKIQLVRDQKQLGIYKALGYTTGQLMMQTAMSYIPVVFAGSILGCILAWFLVNPTFILSLSAFGIKKCDMNVNVIYMFGIIAGIVLWALLITLICSVRIKKIAPWKMIQEI